METEKKVFFIDLGTIEGRMRSIDYLFGTELLMTTTARHEVCDAEMDFYGLSEGHNVIVCRKCALRIPYPNNIQDWNHLVNWFKNIRLREIVINRIYGIPDSNMAG